MEVSKCSLKLNLAMASGSEKRHDGNAPNSRQVAIASDRSMELISREEMTAGGIFPARRWLRRCALSRFRLSG